MAHYASGKRALALCDRCGFPYKLKTLRELIVNDERTNLLVCTECWEVDHPQNKLGKYRVEDFQAIRNPRPDHRELAEGRALVFQVPEATVITRLSGITVTV